MHIIDFYNTVKSAFNKQNEINSSILQTEINKYFLKELDRLVDDDGANKSLQMTRATILVEGFYRHLDTTELKKTLAVVRARRWDTHFGTPTVPFLLSHKIQIDRTKQLFDEFSDLTPFDPSLPWLINKEIGLIVDSDNDVLADPKSISRVVAPSTREITGVFTKTLNPFGGFATAPCDPVSQRFIEHAAIVAKSGGKVLEIGAAFGAATLEALARGATVFCNDIDPDNLAVVYKRSMDASSDATTSTTGDSSKLVLIPGMLPDELVGLPEKFFDAILICRVLHFLPGTKIEESLALMSRLLAPGGKIYIVCETPFLKNWQRFLPEFNRRVESGVEWPGEVSTPADYESSGRAGSLPKFVHWITKEVLERCLLRAGLGIEHSAYIDRSGQFPDDLLLPEHGKESIGAIGFSI